jgi:hypothetical protein
VAENRYYEPSDRGHEAVVADRLRGWRQGAPGSMPEDPDDDGSAEGSAGASAGGSADPDPADGSPDRK